YKNFMLGNWAWTQANQIEVDALTKGAAFVPIILDSDKTMVTIITGQADNWPVYLSFRNIHNNVRCAHCQGVELL
ncbi:hypothetical protein EV363DRAFT_1095310, partial [Boletus edulis]